VKTLRALMSWFITSVIGGALVGWAMSDQGILIHHGGQTPAEVLYGMDAFWYGFTRAAGLMFLGGLAVPVFVALFDWVRGD
jgi:hypothetical protein